MWGLRKPTGSPATAQSSLFMQETDFISDSGGEGFLSACLKRRKENLPLHVAVQTCFRTQELCDKPKLILQAKTFGRVGKHFSFCFVLFVFLGGFPQQPRRCSIKVVQ